MKVKSSIILIECFLLLAACTATPPPPAECTADAHGLQPLPTRPLSTDPDLNQPHSTAVPGGSANCLPTATAVPLSTPPSAFQATDLSNETLDLADQQMAAAAVGDDILALAWLQAGDLVVALARGGSYLQARRVDRADTVSLVFSTVNRLHLAYEQDGQVVYRAADQDRHPAQPSFLGVVAPGHNPQVALDSRNWAHILYEADGQIWHAAHLYQLMWQIEAIGPGHSPRVITYPDDPTTPDVDEGGFALSYLEGNTLHLRTYGMTLLLLPGWTSVSQIPLSQPPAGAVSLDSVRDGTGNRLLAAAWVTHAAAPVPPPAPVPPHYEPANPLAPNAVVNPQWVQTPFNAMRIHTDDARYDGGLYQTIPITPGTTLTFSAYGQAWSSDGEDPDVSVNPADMRLQIGLDPRGGHNPDADSVIWSDSGNPLNSYAPFTISATAVFDSVTLFLRARPDGVRAHNEVYWDSAAVSSGSLVNGNFEGSFIGDGFTIPDGWEPFYEDGGTGNSGAARDQDTVYAAWSGDGGATWSSPFPVSANRTPAQGLTGAIQPAAYPFLSLETNPASLHVFFVYETGDPPPGTTFRRWGRPTVMHCALETAVCDDPPGITLTMDTPPAADLVLGIDPLDRRRGLLAWSGLQTDNTARDVWATTVVLR